MTQGNEIYVPVKFLISNDTKRESQLKNEIFDQHIQSKKSSNQDMYKSSFQNENAQSSFEPQTS